VKATEPSYQRAIDAVGRYRDRHDATLSVGQKETLDEIVRRLHRLAGQAKQLIELNNAFLETEGLTTEFDPTTDTVTVRVGDIQQSIKLKRADPNVPIKMEGLTAGGAYKAGVRAGDPSGVSESQRLIYEGLLEDYYHNAHRVLKLMRLLPGQADFKCREITIVRNKLVEHPDEGEPYSFGFGSAGPVVRPMQRPGREWRDEGLVSNTERFVNELASALERGA